ncbi:MAG: hypothetical protein QOD86_498 [Miltoncostaeaceae bacterium]|jgi:uncharacterized membrane protein YbhN (UPF0104 family)|nr:hypothetical protein [Miltoncostaeaceae bacterium]
MDSVRSFLDAVQAFGERIAAVDPRMLAAALALSLLNLVLRSRGWRNILRAAFPESPIRARTAFGAYVAGVGVNAVVPARVGDIVKVFLAKRKIEGTNYPTLAATLVCETIVDMVLALGLIVYALQAGLLPGLPRLPKLPAFELSWVAEYPWISGIVAGVLLLVLLLAIRRVQAFWRKFGRGLTILRTPGKYVGGVVTYQVAGWCCRIAAAGFFLEAFHVPASAQAMLLVIVAGNIGKLLPATPGGLGPVQALLVVFLAGTATRSDVLAFSVGMEISLMVFNALMGITAIAIMSGRGLRLRATIAAARRGGAGDASGA